jgi:NADH dehydrogenase
MTRVLVTGGTGFVGRSTVRWLVGMGHEVRCLVRATSTLDPLAGRSVEYWRGDVTQPATLPPALEGMDAVVHLVAIIRERPAQGVTFERVNAQGTRDLVEAARAAGIRRFVHISAIGVRPDPAYPYWNTKWEGEQAVRDSGLPWTVFRPSLIVGEGGEFLGRLADLVRKPPAGLFAGPPVVPVLGDGRTRFQPIWVEDAARCIAIAVGDQSDDDRLHTIGGPEVWTYEEILDLVMETVGKRRWKLHVPLALAMPNVKLTEMLLSDPPATSGQVAMLAYDNIAENTDVIEREFGFRPKGLREIIGFLRQAA